MRAYLLILGAAVSTIIMAIAASSAFAAMRLQIQPIRLEMEAGRAGSFKLVNHDDRPVQLEARAFAWRQEVNGKDALTPTRDMVLTPPIMRIDAGATQVIRLALRSDAQPAAQTETAYRLMLEELASTDEMSGIQLRMRYLLPIFVRNGAVTAGPVSLRAHEAGASCQIEAENAGTKHVRVESMQVQTNDKTIEIEAPLYVLAGAQLELACPEEVRAQGRLEGIRLESDAGVFTDAGGADGSRSP